MPDTICFSADQLRLCLDPEYRGIHDLDANPPPGTVACTMVDRAEPWDVFVVVSANPETKKLRVIYPRIQIAFRTITCEDHTDDHERLECNWGNHFCGCWRCDVCRTKRRETYTVTLGQDKKMVSALKVAARECTCPSVSQGGDFFCHCGAVDINRVAYHGTFVPAQPDETYTVHEIDNINLTRDSNFAPWFATPTLEELVLLDKQSGPHCC